MFFDLIELIDRVMRYINTYIFEKMSNEYRVS